MKILTSLIITLLFWSCAKNTNESIDTRIIKTGNLLPAAGETTPVVFNNKLMIVSFGRASVDLSGGFIQVQEYQSATVLSITPFPYGYGSALVVRNSVYAFGSSESSPGNSIVMTQSIDLISWSSPVVIWTADSNQIIYNTSATSTAAGYALVYEIHEVGNFYWFYERFLSSTDLITWNAIGSSYTAVAGLSESACPTLRFVNGYYYLFTTGDNGATEGARYETFIAQSSDLVNFNTSSMRVLSSNTRNDEGNNNSDIDMTEFNGILYITYGVGNQTTWGAMKMATFNGNLADFVGWYF